MARVRKKCIWESKKNPRRNKLLIYYDPKKPSLLAFDASLYGVWAVLSHWMPDGSEKPITFSSRTLSKAEHNYSQIEKEALTIVYPVKKFHSNLFRKHFLSHTDHKPLLGLLSEQKGIKYGSCTHTMLGYFIICV